MIWTRSTANSRPGAFNFILRPTTNPGNAAWTSAIPTATRSKSPKAAAVTTRRARAEKGQRRFSRNNRGKDLAVAFPGSAKQVPTPVASGFPVKKIQPMKLQRSDVILRLGVRNDVSNPPKMFIVSDDTVTVIDKRSDRVRHVAGVS